MTPGSKPAPPQQSSLTEMWAGRGKKTKGKEKEDNKEGPSLTHENGLDDKMKVDGMKNGSTSESLPLKHT